MSTQNKERSKQPSGIFYHRKSEIRIYNFPVNKAGDILSSIQKIYCNQLSIFYKKVRGKMVMIIKKKNDATIKLREIVLELGEAGVYIFMHPKVNINNFAFII
jgi:hypothetical protein